VPIKNYQNVVVFGFEEVGRVCGNRGVVARLKSAAFSRCWLIAESSGDDTRGALYTPRAIPLTSRDGSAVMHLELGFVSSGLFICAGGVLYLCGDFLHYKNSRRLLISKPKTQNS
jgi:hypothetical protein